MSVLDSIVKSEVKIIKTNFTSKEEPQDIQQPEVKKDGYREYKMFLSSSPAYSWGIPTMPVPENTEIPGKSGVSGKIGVTGTSGVSGTNESLPKYVPGNNSIKQRLEKDKETEKEKVKKKEKEIKKSSGMNPISEDDVLPLDRYLFDDDDD